MTKICHCTNCLYESECHDNEWSLYINTDPCCPNMKDGRKQYKQFLEEYLKEKDYI